MKVDPISVLTYLRWDHMHQAVYERTEHNGNIRVSEQKFPLYNKQGAIEFHNTSTLDLRA
jgi:hypothetical protein